MNQIKVSIITIAYNSEASIERTIKSVLNQTYEYIEYVVVDGASKDGTLNIIKKYEPSFNGRMKWKSEPDKGIYDAMNKGICIATGDMIGIVNSDDWLEPDAIENVVKLAKITEGYDKCIFCGSLRFHYKDGNQQLMKSDEKKFHEGMKRDSLNHGAFHPSMVVGREVYNTVGVFDEHFSVIADTDFISRCYKSDIRFVFLDAVVNNMSDGGASNKMNLKKRVPDMIYKCKKNGYGSVKTYWNTILYILKLAIKAIVGENIMRRYRLRNAK